ncbi:MULTISPECIES: S-methyl-5-thioribose kinase [Caldilinea]|jgi:5-methylthioribose kinase|uniref:S-methyl-5-thioribose kinase n=1 Tax=Caldilinea aerophila (strain DSM 14535 / JCM 11387 / NBRC 104270 / STL-6-O1) TaxID=926550 RepID=I0I0Z9_CALAS|nr:MULTISPECIES: S-methyl-5-thioribose kinase [Caldilinea]BAL98936.1 methylthioribose kinase [Caldilinea aerophila DSM 14535 = NBRC 104270]GIV74477.1 MAG: methylthioribose kinase [Caldilinea sp.]
MTAYHPLDSHSVIDYLRATPSLADVLDLDAPMHAREVGDGNLNQVFIVANGTSDKSLVVKQALPYLRVAGESWPLTRERMRFETQALLKHNELAPGLVPQVYHYDEAMSLVVMENLSHLEVMRRPLVARKRFPHFADHISTFLARTLFFTSDFYLTGLEKKELQAQFINPHLCKIQEDFVFTNPFMDSPENRWNPLLDAEVQAVRRNSALKLALAEMKASYMTHAEALIHSDLHTGSIMANEETTKVIDPEFAFYGPMGFDIGAVLENLVLNYLSHFAHTPEVDTRKEYQAYLLGLIREIWTQFAAKFEALWLENNRGELMPAKYWDYPGGEEAFAEFRRRTLAHVLRETAGHGGAKMLRRMMGIVSVWDITSIADLAQRAVAERLAIRIGSRWVMERNAIHSIDDLIGIVCEEAECTG